MKKIIAFTALTLLLLMQNTSAKESMIARLKEFSCGDNCYLVVLDNKGKEHTLICSDKICEKWADSNELPAELLHAVVEITTSTKNLYSASGKIVGRNLSADKIFIVSIPKKVPGSDSGLSRSLQSNLPKCAPITQTKVWDLCFGTRNTDRGDTYAGEWKASKRHGYGNYRWFSGSMYDGFFEDGLFEGYGIYTWENGSRTEGMWSKDKKNGVHIQYDEKGKIEGAGVFKDGKFVKSENANKVAEELKAIKEAKIVSLSTRQSGSNATSVTSVKNDNTANCPGETQIDMNTCAASDYTRADDELNAVWRKLPKSKELLASQRAWIAYRDAECSFQKSQFEGGSIAPLIYSKCLSELTKQRTKIFNDNQSMSQ